MHLYASTMDIGVLLQAAKDLLLRNYPGAEVQAYYVAPDEDVEVFDRILETDLSQRIFVTAEWAGEEPAYVRDARRYHRRYTKVRTCKVTFASSIYRLRPVTVILQSKHDADIPGIRAVTFRVIVCDTDNRLGLPAFLAEDLKTLEAEEEKDTPQFDEELLLVRS